MSSFRQPTWERLVDRFGSSGGWRRRGEPPLSGRGLV